jgi:hypothetical protein
MFMAAVGSGTGTGTGYTWKRPLNVLKDRKTQEITDKQSAKCVAGRENFTTSQLCTK